MSRHINGVWPDGSEGALALIDTVIAEDSRDDGASLAGAERRVWSALEAQRRRRIPRGFGLGFATLAMAACALALTLHSTVKAPLTHATVAVKQPVAGRPNLVDLHGAARLVTTDESRFEIAADDDRGVLVVLDRGSLLLQVNPRPIGAPFRVRTPHAEVKVVGTVLWVFVDAEGAATVAVGHGTVEVTPSGGAPAAVHAGERWPQSSLRAPRQSELTALGTPESALHWAGEEIAPPTVTLASESSAIGPAAATADVCHKADGAAAIACLEQVASGSDSLRAESALFEIGWRRLRAGGDPRGALSAWEEQRSRFPLGVLRADADVSIIEALGRVGDDARARREIDTWLGAHPNDLAAPQIHYLRGSLDRRSGDCKRALDEFDIALRSPAGPWAEAARAERTACQRSGH